MNHADKGDKFDVDLTLDDGVPDDFDALMIPGGLMNPDELRSTPKATEFARHFFASGKPVAAICHGPWVLIDAGANSVDEEVVVDNGLVTSRRPDDIPAFNKKMIEEFAEGKHRATSGASSRSDKAAPAMVLET